MSGYGGETMTTPKTDLDSLPAEERARIQGAAADVASAVYCAFAGGPSARPTRDVIDTGERLANEARAAVVAREVAAYHAWAAGRPLCRVCDHPFTDHGPDPRNGTDYGIPGACDGYEPADPETLTRAEAERGLYRKYDVRRTDGSSGPGGKHADCDYYVLDWQHDRFAPAAMRIYADRCEASYSALAADIRARADKAERDDAQTAAVHAHRVGDASPGETEPRTASASTIRDAFEAMLAFLTALLSASPRVSTRTWTEADPVALRDLIQRAAEEHARASATWDPIGGRPASLTTTDLLEGATMGSAGAAARVTEEELAEIERIIAAPLKACTVGDILSWCRRLATEVRALRAEGSPAAPAWGEQAIEEHRRAAAAVVYRIDEKDEG